MPLRALTISHPEWFKPPGQKGDAPAEFKCRGLDGRELAEVSDGVTVTDDAMLVFTADAIARIFGFGLVDWRNVIDGNDRQIDFPNDPEDVQRALPYSYQVAIAAQIFNSSFVSPADKKKSS